MTYIYALICPLEGEIKYVGKTKQLLRARFKQHLRMYDSDASHKKKDWINQLLNQNIYPVLSVLEICEKGWESREKYWIKKLNPKLNIAEGGESVSYWTGKKRSQATKDKISKTKKGTTAWNKGIKMSKEFCEKARKAQTGKKLSEEHKANISKGIRRHLGK